MRILRSIFCLLVIFSTSVLSQNRLSLSNDYLNIQWVNIDGVWKLKTFDARVGGENVPYGNSIGECCIMYSEIKPSLIPVSIVEHGDTLDFPENTFKYVKPDFQRAISSVPMNTAGQYITFYPAKGKYNGKLVEFEKKTEYGVYKVKWELDQQYPTDILLDISFMVEKEGYYSIPTPTLGAIDRDNLAWGLVPGFYQGNQIQESFPLSYAYAQGLPEYPVLCRESTITTMASLMSCKNGLTLAVIPEPGQDRNPYKKDIVTHFTHWNIALSHMDRKKRLTPIAYHPVLGENDSFKRKGEVLHFRVRLSLQHADWYSVYKHVIYDIYKLKKSLDLRTNEYSLSSRLLSMYEYVLDDKTALWHEEEYKGKTIIAQSYMSGVVGSDNDAMKNSDIGAMWMLGKITGDSLFNSTRIPYVRNFKMLQQVDTGFFKGAVEGQYYLSKSKQFTEEWGNHFEPIAITYYTMSDLGNILLFEPDNKELIALLKNGAERLLEWQKEDGSWVVAYDRDTYQPIYNDLIDLRPTFYGLVIAYKILKDAKYLIAAQKGAQWYIDNAVKKGHFLGVCGDARFVNDFATIQSAGALLDLYEITSDTCYLDAAVATARMYTTSIYTHPIPNKEIKILNGQKYEDWQLSQIGSSFEHGGAMGSAVKAGPILLASHCSLFLKLYMYTKDVLFKDMARLAALGKDAFVNKDTGVASYYWIRFDNGSGPFPHHAWWQIGWIYDYLVAEAELRSNGAIYFPRGFMTSKVGPHKTLGFKSGTINESKVNLILRQGLVNVENPNIDYLTAITNDGNFLFIVVLNSSSRMTKAKIRIDTSVIRNNFPKAIEEHQISLEPFGYTIIKLKI
ncbi:MAG: glycerophosphoryl diester phosphodiesterase [Bacteroides xylanisolvens]|nr:MAG: glycerophosphoryl diester phosphodiesterase [Bacteroides xylanisolvens]